MDNHKVAVLTAAGTGMGADAAKKLASKGFKISILSSSGKGEQLANDLGGIGVTGSNQSENDLKKLIDATLEKWGRIDVLVNSAGHGPRGPILDLTDEDWQQGMAVVTYEPGNGNFNVELIPISRGEAIFRGKYYSAKD